MGVWSGLPLDDVTEPAAVSATTADVAWIGLVGVVVGALIAAAAQLVAARITTRHAKTTRQGERLTAHVTSLWTACDTYWRARDSLTWVVDAIVSDRGNRSGSQDQQLEEDRQERFVLIRSAEMDSASVLALLRIEFPDLADSATRLRDAAADSRGGIEALDARRQAYEEARETFEDEARSLLERYR